MAQTIPVSQIVTINPAVVGAGGNPLSLNAIMLDQSLTVPITSLLSFPSADDVGLYFGTNSTQKALADTKAAEVACVEAVQAWAKETGRRIIPKNTIVV